MYHLPFLPASRETIENYISYCHLKGLSYATILSRVSVISYVHKVRHQHDATSDVRVKAVLKGLSKSSHTFDVRSPVTLPVLRSICSKLHRVVSDSYQLVMCRAIFTFMFHLALRVGEIAVTDGNSDNVLGYKDIEFFVDSAGEKCLRVAFKKYKHSHSPALVLVKSDSSPVCPVSCMDMYLRKRQASNNPHLFVHRSHKSVSSDYLRKILQCVVVYADLPRSIALHSFRIGKITQLVSEGCSENTVRLIGRFKSDAFKRYMRVSNLSMGASSDSSRPRDI